MMNFLKICFSFLLILNLTSLSARGSGDSTKLYRRFSVEVGTSAFSFFKYRLPNYSNLNPSLPPCYKCGTQKKRTPWGGDPYDFQFLSFKYSAHKRLKLNLNMMHLRETIGAMNTDYETIRPNVTKITTIGFLSYRYVSLSPSIIGMIKCGPKGKFYTNLEAGINFDFIYKEIREKGQVVVDSVYYVWGVLGDTVLSGYYLPESTRKGNVNFNRISPFVHLYMEWYSYSKAISVSLGAAFTFESIFQLKNTSEFYKCYKINPLVIGLSYHIK